MKTKFLIGAFAFLMALGFTACDDSSSADDNSGTQTPTQPGNGGDGGNSGKDNSNLGDICGAKPEAGCNFKKEDKVWKFVYKDWNYIDIYTWTDDSTVEFKECMNAYHMDRNDSTYTNVTRDEMFEKVMADCETFADTEGGN
ncbi:MAG: hypothetical protein IKC23_02120 [Fibrobacter sp.]|nr:hypothetical protein [Fibrobacter sp.]